MDFSASTLDLAPRDDVAARNRFETFKLGKGFPPAAAVTNGSKHGHTRSHSRNASISSSISLKSTTLNDLSHFSFPNNHSNLPPVSLTPSLTNPTLAPSTKRNSHHRRRSSVSTRRESAEMMGVALPDLPASTSEDNVNLGDKDSIRRRALWALEGKPDVAFAKVEIPDITTPDIEKMLCDFTTKSSSYSNSLAGSKRDSFKLLGPSLSSKDQLGTLLEEEEEEEESIELPPASASKENLPPPNTPITPITPRTPVPPTVAVIKPTPAKPRPSTLNLRPLSLTPDSISSVVPCLPSPTPSPRTGIRPLSLASASSVDDVSESSLEKQSLPLMTSSVAAQPAGKQILNLALDQIERSKSLDEERKPVKRSSISYKRSSSNSVTMLNMAGLPTPEMTPTFARRYSNADSNSADEEVFANHPAQTRPLSASEQHFLFKSHNALLARITDLERALSMRRRESGGYSNGGSSRPLSVASSFSSSSDVNLNSASSEGPSDEMLRLIADLKSERDELKRDVDGWRRRVGDMENQMNVLTKRVENERRDAWVARSRVGLLEVEKGVLSKRVEDLDDLIIGHEQDKREWEQEVAQLKKENMDSKARIADLAAQLELAKKELESSKERKVQEESDPLATPTPGSFVNLVRPVGFTLNKKRGLGFTSVDSESSMTDVEMDSSDDNKRAFGFALKSVEEEADEAEYSEEENALVGYEDEGDEDTDMSLQSSSSFDSEEDLPHSVTHVQNAAVPSTPPTPRMFTHPPGHERRATLSKTWTFPAPGQLQTPPKDDESPVDRFFGCLDDDSDTACSVPGSPSQYSYEKSKSLFASGFKFASPDDDASFFLPQGVEIPVVELECEEEQKRLEAVAEEDEEAQESGTDFEDEENMFEEEIEGIRFTFTPPQDEPVVEERKQIQMTSPTKHDSPPPILPALDFGHGNEEEEDDEEEESDLTRGIPFKFSRSRDECQPSPPPSPTFSSASVIVAITPPVSPRPASLSMIPRPASPSTISRPVSPPVESKPLAHSSIRVAPTTVEPLSKIPSVRASSSSNNSNAFVTPPNKRGGALPSFIPQPVSSPSPIRTLPSATSKPKVIPTSTFIRQPTRKSMLSTLSTPGKTQNNTNENFAMNVQSSRRSSNEHAALPAAAVFDTPSNQYTNSSSQMRSVDFSRNNIFSSQAPQTYRQQLSSVRDSQPSDTPSMSSLLSSPVSPKLSFQTFSKYIPLSWSSRALASTTATPLSTSKTSNADDLTIVRPVTSRRSSTFVPREQQLRKLKIRMEAEGILAMRPSVNVHCKKCNGRDVFI